MTISDSSGGVVRGRYALQDGVLRFDITDGPPGDKRVFNSYPFVPRR